MQNSLKSFIKEIVVESALKSYPDYGDPIRLSKDEKNKGGLPLAASA